MSINLPNGSFQTTEVTTGTNYIVGFDVAISQTEVPYILPLRGLCSVMRRRARLLDRKGL